MSFSVVRATALSILVLSTSISGCSSAGDSRGLESEEAAGSLGLSLQAAAGITLPFIDYSIQGTNGFTKSGVLIVTNSTVISAVIGGIPSGSGYTITLFGTSSGTVPTVTCTGSVSFAVEAQQTATAQVSLFCKQPPTTGSVAVSGSLEACPSITELSLTPAEVAVGGSTFLIGRATDVHPANALTYQWLVTSGSVANVAASGTTFTCTQAGPVTVTFSVSDGKCADAATAQLTCSPAQGCGNGQLEAGEQCDDGNQQGGDGCSASCALDDDLSTPGDDRAGYFGCNTAAAAAAQVTCAPGQTCCDDVFCAASCGGVDNEFCDGPEDCTKGERYCIKGSHGAYCGSNAASAVGVFCHHDADCVGADPYVPTLICGPKGLCQP